MVVFVCGSCGSSLKKNQVQTHTYKCRHFQYVSCMDCSKDFGINDYALHTKCITEAEKYGGNNYVAKDASGEKKQTEWISKVHKYVQNEQNIKPRMRDILIQLTNFENLPRKKAKFENFARQSVRLHQRDIAEVWEIFNGIIQDDKKSSEMTPSKDLSTNGTAKVEDVNGKEETEEENHKKRKMPHEEKNNAKEDESSEPKKKKNKRQKQDDEPVNGEAKENGKDKKHKRRKKSEIPESDLSEDEKKSESKKKKKKNKKQKANVEQETVNGENEEVKAEKTEEAEDAKDSMPQNGYGTPFKWKTTITRCLQSSTEKGLKITKLKKLVISEYYAAHGEDEHVKSESELTALLNKKLSHRNDKYVVIKDRVKLRCASE